jgi:ornithine cyclodeaminase/alanine dehydrogenase-like protein (mu-crystallin family)
VPLLLNEDEIRRLLSMDDLIHAMRGALVAFSRGEVVQPVRTAVQVGSPAALFGLMPAYVPSAPALGAKLVTVFAKNALRGLPTHLATIILLDPETGALMAIMDGRYITEARTAAVSAVSLECLASSTAQTLAILGSGVQAHSHVLALCHVRRFTRIRAWSPTRAHLLKFVENAGSEATAEIEAADSAETAVRGADVIVLATSAPAPVINDAWVEAGAHVISLGGIRGNLREMDPALVARASLFVDSRAAAIVEAGDIVLGVSEGRFTEDHIRAELGEVADGRAPGRRSAKEVTIFKSLGLAVEDVAAADLAYRRARERGVGREI